MNLRILATLVCLLLGADVPALALTAAETPVGSKNRKACDPECSASPKNAESPYYPFEEMGDDATPIVSQRWHRELENNRQYGESWFFMVQTGEGGVLFVNISIANMGLATFDSALDVRFYPPQGDAIRLYRSYDRKNIFAAADGLDIRIAGNRLHSSEDTTTLRIDEPELELELTMIRNRPAFHFGNGRVHFFEDRSALWGIGFEAPRARTGGSLKSGGQIFSLAGDGYHDHTWSTIRLPSFAEKWNTLRFYQGGFSIVLHQIHLTRKFGGGMLCMGFVEDAQERTPIRCFVYKPLRWRTETVSGLDIPIELKLSIRTESHSITGLMREVRLLDAIDALAQLSWPVQQVVKSFYTRPYMVRYLVDCRIDVTGRDGRRRQLSGYGVAGANWF
jgi:hypothetical protein